jgi:putative oxidoreductase
MITNALLATWSPRLLSMLRIVAALLFLQHGLAKLLHFPHVVMFDQLQLFSLLGLAGVIGQGELAILFCFVFLYLVAADGGPWSVDEIRGEKTG